MKLNPKIDELLNSFTDGELTTRQQTEVHRLAAHDPQVRQRLKSLQKCKLLLGSLPCAQAPSTMAEDVVAALERKTLLGRLPSPMEQKIGARHLFIRKVLSVAAIIVLVAVLSAVVYVIVTPRRTPQPPNTITARTTPPAVEPIESAPTVVAAGFTGRLELKTSSFIEVDASINRAVADNDLLNCISLSREPDRSEYVLACTPKGLDELLSDLEAIWHNLDSATLSVQTEEFGRPVVVDAVTAPQVLEIASQNTAEKSVEVAKDLAVLNNLAEVLPGKEVLAAASAKTSDFAVTSRIPKPVLTGWPKTIKTSPRRVETKGNVNLVITVLTGR